MTKNQKFMIFFIFFASLSLFYDISTSKVFLRQKAIHTTYMHYISSKKHDLNDFEKNRKCPHGKSLCDSGG